ncbi:MAG TPA: ChbG/HpnK family deacetylase, partial [Armatimonadota bacterium]|nr:ChbG/HpnK family deacetylase [Armatimonadota bacterium]
HYRWGPVLSKDRAGSLFAGDGYLYPTESEASARIDPKEAEAEIRAQIERGRQFGMKPTHVDSHMGTLFSAPRYFEAYTRVSKEFGILPMLMEPSPEINLEAKALGLDYEPLAQKLRDQKFLLLNALITGATAGGYEARKKQYHDMIRGLKPGVTEIIVHLAGNDEEIRAVTGTWENRWNELRIFTDADTKALIREQNVKLIGYRLLAALWKEP